MAQDAVRASRYPERQEPSKLRGQVANPAEIPVSLVIDVIYHDFYQPREALVSDFLSFETFIAPKIIRIVFLIGLVLIAVGVVVRVIVGLVHLELIAGVILPLIAAILAAVGWRIYCELVLVFFDMRDKLAEIAKKP